VELGVAPRSSYELIELASEVRPLGGNTGHQLKVTTTFIPHRTGLQQFFDNTQVKHADIVGCTE